MGAAERGSYLLGHPADPCSAGPPRARPRQLLAPLCPTPPPQVVAAALRANALLLRSCPSFRACHLLVRLQEHHGTLPYMQATRTTCEPMILQLVTFVLQMTKRYYLKQLLVLTINTATQPFMSRFLAANSRHVFLSIQRPHKTSQCHLFFSRSCTALREVLVT